MFLDGRLPVGIVGGALSFRPSTSVLVGHLQSPAIDPAKPPNNLKPPSTFEERLTMNSSQMQTKMFDASQQALQTFWPGINFVNDISETYLGFRIIPIATSAFVIWVIAKFFTHVLNSMSSTAAPLFTTSLSISLEERGSRRRSWTEELGAYALSQISPKR